LQTLIKFIKLFIKSNWKR